MLRIFILIILLICDIFSDDFIEAQKALDKKEYKKAKELFYEEYKKNNPQAAFKLGIIHFKTKEFDKAMQYFEVATTQDQIKPKYNIAMIYANKGYKNHNLRKSYNIFLDLAQNGYAPAQNKIGLFLLYGVGEIEKDYKQAVYWFEQSYFNGNYEDASCNLALMYASGKGVFPNYGRARELAQKGYENNIPSCKKVYEEFNLKKYDKDKGFKYGFYK